MQDVENKTKHNTIYNYDPLCMETSRLVNLRGKLFSRVIVLLYFCQCSIGYLPCGGKLGCSAGNNRVVSQQRKCCQYLIGYLPCGGQLGCLAGNSRCSSAGNNRVVSRQRKFWQNISITIILLSAD